MEAQGMLDDLKRQKFERIQVFTNGIHTAFQKNPRVAYSIVQKVVGSKGRVKIETPMEECVKHFSEILSPKGSDQIDSLPLRKKDLIPPMFCDDLPTMQDLENVLSMCLPDRSTGCDGIPWEVWYEARFELLEAFIEIWKSGEVPKEWRTSIVTPVPKKGDITNIVNNRPVALLSHAAKLFNAIILKRIRDALDFTLGDSQNGFRRNRNTLQHVLTLQLLIQNSQSAKKGEHPLYMAFVDFKNAFSSISWRALAKTLDYYYVPLSLQALIMSMYEGHTVKLRVNGSLSDEFALSRGVLQGDTLAPYLFIMALQRVLDNVDQLSDYGIPARAYLGQMSSSEMRLRQRLTQGRLRSLAYADDIVLLADSQLHLQDLLQLLQQRAEEIGLFMNFAAGKTECMSFGTQHLPKVFNLQGERIRPVKSYKYLGVTLPEIDHHFTNRVRAAWAAAIRLRTIWKSNLPVHDKRKLFVALVETSLLYGVAQTALSKTATKRVHGVHSKLLQFCLNMKAEYDKLLGPHLEDIYGNLPTAEVKLFAMRFEMFGHWVRGHRSKSLCHPLIPLLNYDPFKDFGVKRSKTNQITWQSQAEFLFGMPFIDIQDLCLDRGRYSIACHQIANRIQKSFYTELFTARAKRFNVTETKDFVNEAMKRVVWT
jgi:hypothetical protein